MNSRAAKLIRRLVRAYPAIDERQLRGVYESKPQADRGAWVAKLEKHLAAAPNNRSLFAIADELARFRRPLPPPARG